MKELSTVKSLLQNLSFNSVLLNERDGHIFKVMGQHCCVLFCDLTKFPQVIF